MEEAPKVFATLTTPLILAVRLLGTAVRHRARADDQDGMSTLEIVIIALGLLTIAGIAVAALTAAVNRRVGQLQ